MAAAALLEKKVKRIVLARPAGRGRGAARLSARRHGREGQPVPAAALRRALRHPRLREDGQAARARRDRGRSDRVHARPHVERRVHHPGRGAEHDLRADADVPDADRLRLEGGRDRRRHAGRPSSRARPPGLREAQQLLSRVEGIRFVLFDERDVVRHPLVQSIITAYEAWTASARRPLPVRAGAEGPMPTERALAALDAHSSRASRGTDRRERASPCAAPPRRWSGAIAYVLVTTFCLRAELTFRCAPGKAGDDRVSRRRRSRAT